MTERCQTKFTEKIDNKNYIIYVSIIVVSIAVLYFYRFHFATICFSYVLGCLVCYYGINTGILYIYSKQLKCHFLKNKLEDIKNNDTPKGCFACGSKECQRHDSTASTEPWVGLQIHKQLDQAIEDFYNTILDQFINSWYSKITLQPFFVDELRHQLRYASACLLRRAVKINYSRFITERLIPCALRHYTVCADLSPGTPLLDSKLAVHPAAANRNAELKYLRCITNAIMPYLLKTSEVNNSVFRVLIREIFAGWVLLSLTDVLADPYILNTLIVLATGDETMAHLPTTPNYKVEFLETFARQTDSVYLQRSKLLRIDLDLVIHDQGYFYAFMQYMKTTSHMHLLQFYKDIKSFQTEILNPDLSDADLELLHKEACDMYARYIHENNDVKVPMQSELAIEFAQILDKGPNSVKRLQNCRPLFEAARQSQATLEKIMLPKFMHSEDFYQLTLGPRMPTGFHKNMVRRLQEKSSIKLTSKVKGTLKTQTLDGQVLENSTESEAECAENMDILKYLDSVVAEETLREQDLSTYKVVLTNVETRPQALPRRGTVRLFTVAVHSAGGVGGARLWALERSENDFHLLRHKLHEYHGERLLHDLPLPSRRDNSPLETIRYKYEDFLQRLLQKSLLQTSELLHLFLTVDGDFSMVVQASTLNANSTDLANIYQSVTHRLKKEKGQHLENFLGNLLVSSDMERFQALKQGRDVEEAQEVIEDMEQEPQRRTANARNIHYTIFGNNFNRSPVISETRDRGYQTDVVGFTQCFMYLLIKVIRVPGIVAAVIGSLLSVIRDLVDELFNWYLNDTLRSVLSERRLAHLIRLGHGELFGKKVSPRVEAATQSERARSQLEARAAASGAQLASGSLLAATACSVHALIQQPHLNKQLVYNLLDLCVMELFPELDNFDMTIDPKS